jgi:hypothetical protein
VQRLPFNQISRECSIPSTVSGFARETRPGTYRGLTVSHPDPELHYFGFAYEDAKDGRTDEDIYILDTTSQEMSYYGRGRVEKLDPRYKHTHRGDKSYLD